MEKSWENFWTTGKVEDYLTYRNGMTEKEERLHGTAGSCNGHGAYDDADIRIRQENYDSDQRTR